jgi:hypothetical protein
MQIAEYLECSMESRNNLLLAARYLPENLELEGDALMQALGLCCKKEADLVQLGKSRTTKRIHYDRTEPIQVASFPTRPHSDVA